MKTLAGVVSVVALLLAAIISDNPNLALVWLGGIGVLWGVFEGGQ